MYIYVRICYIYVKFFGSLGGYHLNYMVSKCMTCTLRHHLQCFIMINYVTINRPNYSTAMICMIRAAVPVDFHKLEEMPIK